MSRSPVPLLTRALAAACAAVLLVRCADPAAPEFGSPGDRVSAKASGGTSTVSVTAASPAYGRQGQTDLVVTVTGSGFDAGSVAAWQRGGAVDGKIVVKKTTFVSSTRLDVTIDVAADATLGFYDIAVTTARGTKGIGTETWEATIATSIGTLGGNTLVDAVNDTVGGWQATGYTVVNNSQRVFAWRATGTGTGEMRDLGPGFGHAIDRAGVTIASRSGGWATVHTWTNGQWVAMRLPTAANAVGSSAGAIASDANGIAYLIGGSERIASKGNGGLDRPRLWRRLADGRWDLDSLPMPRPESDAWAGVAGLNDRGEATGSVRVGSAGPQPVFWDANGSVQLLPGPVGSWTGHLNADGLLAAGVSDGAAAYWKATLVNGVRSWTEPFVLRGCDRASGIGAAGRIVVTRCALTNSGRLVPGYWDPPYTTLNYLSGLGDKSDAGGIEAVSPLGRWYGGGSPQGSIRVGALWNATLLPPPMDTF